MDNKKQNLFKTHGIFPTILALVGNGIIVILKFVGFYFFGSGVLFSEAIHSLADTINQSLLLVGIKKSTKKADENFSYGYGRERFFWALISACGIFFLGAGITLYRGIHSLLVKEEIVVNSFVYVILLFSLLLEAIPLLAAFLELKKVHSGKSILELFKFGDPATLAVFYEDGVAVLGVIIAFLSILLTNVTNNYYWDAIGSMIIGILLGTVAIILINKNRMFLIGKSIPRELKEKIIDILVADPAIERVLDFKSSVFNIGYYKIKCEVEFNGPALIKSIYQNRSIREEYELVKDNYDEFVKFCVDFTDQIPRLIGNQIDILEKKIKKEVPTIKHIDIEIN